MNFGFKIRFFQALLLVGVIFFAVSVAQARTSHHHADSPHHHANVVSPFDKTHKDKSLHCILNSHQHLKNAPCPHKKQGGSNDNTILRQDCGTQSGSANSSSSSFAKDFFKGTTHENLESLQFFSKIRFPISFKNQYLPRSIDHPPQLAEHF